MGNWREVLQAIEGHALENEDALGIKYIVPLLNLVTKDHCDMALPSPIVLRIVHALHRNREIEVFRRVQVSHVYMRITRYYFGLTDVGIFRVWDGYAGEMEFTDVSDFVSFLSEIANQILFEL